MNEDATTKEGRSDRLAGRLLAWSVGRSIDFFVTASGCTATAYCRWTRLTPDLPWLLGNSLQSSGRAPAESLGLSSVSPLNDFTRFLISRRLTRDSGKLSFLRPDVVVVGFRRIEPRFIIYGKFTVASKSRVRRRGGTSFTNSVCTTKYGTKRLRPPSPPPPSGL